MMNPLIQITWRNLPVVAVQRFRDLRRFSHRAWPARVRLPGLLLAAEAVPRPRVPHRDGGQAGHVGLAAGEAEALAQGDGKEPEEEVQEGSREARGGGGVQKHQVHRILQPILQVSHIVKPKKNIKNSSPIPGSPRRWVPSRSLARSTST